MARSTHALARGVQRACRPGGSSPSPSARRRAGAAPDGSARHASGKQRGRQMHRHDPGRTRACNLWFRRPTPYPLGRATCMIFLGRHHPPHLLAPPGMALAQGAPTPERFWEEGGALPPWPQCADAAMKRALGWSDGRLEPPPWAARSRRHGRSAALGPLRPSGVVSARKGSRPSLSPLSRWPQCAGDAARHAGRGGCGAIPPC